MEEQIVYFEASGQDNTSAVFDAVDRALSETGIRSKGEALIISVIRAKEKRVFNPPADFVLQAGDCLLYVGTKGTAQRLRSLLSVAAISQEVPSLLY